MNSKQIFLCYILLFATVVSASAQGMRVKHNNFNSFLNYEKDFSPELITKTPDYLKQHPEYGVLPWNAQCEDCVEILEKRTPTSRYFEKKGSNGSTFFVQQAYGPIHYESPNGYLVTLDPHLQQAEEEGLYHAPNQPLPVSIDLKNQRSSIQLMDGNEIVFNGLTNLFYEGETVLNAVGNADRSNSTIGKDGAFTNNIWPGIHSEQIVRRGEIKTNFIVTSKELIPDNTDWMVITDEITFGNDNTGYIWKQDESTGFQTPEGYWFGNYILENNEGDTMLKITKPAIYDFSKERIPVDPEKTVIAFRLIQEEGVTYFETRVSVDWLKDEERKYPVVIDPVLVGEDTFFVSDIGFEYDAMCLNEFDYCSFNLDVTVPGKTTLTTAVFDGTYYSLNNGCSFMFDCIMKEAGFKIIGPCENSPPTGYWTCLPPEGDTAGTCYGEDLDFFNTIACIPPSCDDYVLSFEMRTFMCSCNQPPCGILCHYMPSGSWIITIEGQTVQENPITSSNYPDFTICEGDTIALHPTGAFGVPPYIYVWSPTAETADTIYVSPITETEYTSVIWDLCDTYTDTVIQTVFVNPAPHPAPGPFEDCFEAELDAGAEWIAYEWIPGGETTQTITVDESGTHQVLVTDGLGCSGLSLPIDVVVNFPPDLDVFPDTIIIDEGALADLHAESATPGTVNFNWSPGGTLSCNNCPDPQAFPIGDEVYYVTAEQNGCVSPVDSVVVIVTQVNLIIPNAFTPDGDGLNDIFRVFNPINYPFFEMRIFNRWGEEVFYSTDMANGWNGQVNGKEQEMGTYVWMIAFRKAQAGTDETEYLRGNVTLLR